MFKNIQIDEDELNTRLKNRLFWKLVLTGCIANTVGFLSNAVLFGMTLPTIVCGVCVIMIVLCGVVGIRFGKQRTAAVVMVLMFSQIEFPFLFYIYGANMGVYLVLGIVAVSVASMLCNLISEYMLQSMHLMKASSDLEYATNRDALTGVYNRRYLIHTLKQWMSTEDKHFLVALIDIDDFKSINDTYGHVYGDEILTELARLMKQEICGKGIAARYGGEEFMILFENPDRQMALGILEQIKKGLGSYSMKTRQITITFSGGMDEYRTQEKIDELFRSTDKKLYEAKNGGKNRIVC